MPSDIQTQINLTYNLDTNRFLELKQRMGKLN